LNPYAISFKIGLKLLSLPFEISNDADIHDPINTADGSFLVFSSGRSKIKGQLFIVFRENGQWGTPVMRLGYPRQQYLVRSARPLAAEPVTNPSARAATLVRP